MKLINLLPIWYYLLYSTIVPEVTNGIFISVASNQYRQALLIDLRKTFDLENHQLWLFKVDSIGLDRTKKNWYLQCSLIVLKPRKTQS